MKLKVRLVVSEKMSSSSGKENGYIRFPKLTRNFIAPKQARMGLSANNGENLSLEIKQAYKEDVDLLVGKLKSKKVTEEQARVTGFITQHTAAILTGNHDYNPGQLIKNSIYLSEGIYPLKVGCDPEFAIIDPATKYFKYADKVLHDSGKSQKFGADGPLIELRPDPSDTVEGLSKNIAALFKSDNAKKIIDYDWIGGATYGTGIPNHRILSLGGHIHVGQPMLLQNMKEDKKMRIYKRIINVLDELVALPLVRIDGPEQQKRRSGSDAYGRWGDTRPQQGRFEWRVPSGFWLVHPELTRAVIGTTQAVSEACYEIMAEVDFKDSWVDQSSNDAPGLLQKVGCMPLKKAEGLLNKSSPDDISSELLTSCSNKLRSLPSYERHKDHIEEFISLTGMSTADRNRISLNVKENWLAKKSLTS